MRIAAFFSITFRPRRNAGTTPAVPMSTRFRQDIPEGAALCRVLRPDRPPLFEPYEAEFRPSMEKGSRIFSVDPRQATTKTVPFEGFLDSRETFRFVTMVPLWGYGLSF